MVCGGGLLAGGAAHTPPQSQTICDCYSLSDCITVIPQMTVIRTRPCLKCVKHASSFLLCHALLSHAHNTVIHLLKIAARRIQHGGSISSVTEFSIEQSSFVAIYSDLFLRPLSPSWSEHHFNHENNISKSIFTQYL